MGWIDALKGNVVGLDTSPLIYFTEKHTLYIGILDQLFLGLRNGELGAVTSIITLLEVLVHPIKKGDTTLAQQYRELLLNTSYLSTQLLDQQIAEKASYLRATYKLRTPDAIQVATAIVARASSFLTNDKQLSVVSELKVLILDDLITKH